MAGTRIYVTCPCVDLSGVFGASALSHRPNWPKTRVERLAMQNRKEQLRQQRERELRQVALSERNATIGCGDLAARIPNGSRRVLHG